MGEEGRGETIPAGRAHFLIQGCCRCNEIQPVHIIVNYTRLWYIRGTTLSCAIWPALALQLLVPCPKGAKK